MACNNGLFGGGNCCSWIIILLVLFCFCGGDNGAYMPNNNGCGCGNCGCQNNCGC